MSKFTTLYSFRRCPYAMRARLALYYSNIQCVIREVDLKNKPASLIAISPKGTVPVLQLPEERVIEESLDIMHYALEQHDPEQLSLSYNPSAKFIISDNDNKFVKLLHRYKYFDKYPEQTQVQYRVQAEELFLIKYEIMLQNNQFLLGKKSLADLAILPFIRQFALVDEDWFFSSKYTNINRWLNGFIKNDSFEAIIMAKYSPWKEGDDNVFFLK
jgi:glutathione S-transferase